MSIPTFGHRFRDEHFTTTATCLVNHGSFGHPPTAVTQAFLGNIQRECDFPDKYLRFTLNEDLKQATQEVAQFVGCDPNDVVFVPNATSGVNAILRSFPLVAGDRIAMPLTVYGACGNTVKFLALRHGIVPVVVEVRYPLNGEAILAAFETVFREGTVRLCLFDAVTSMPGVRFPFEAMVALCQKYGVLSLVDGAHSIGLIPYSLRELKPDFFVSNLHKWLYVPRACAFLYVDRRHHRHVHTLPISHSYLGDDTRLAPELEVTRLGDRFAFTGTGSYASIATIPFAIRFRKTVCGGEEAIRAYCHSLAVATGKHVARKWNTSYLGEDDPSIITAMVNVVVPLSLLDGGPALQRLFQPLYMVTFHDTLERWFVEKHGTYIQSDVHGGILYVRFSCQVYNELSDFDTAADIYLDGLRHLIKTTGLLER